MKDSRVAISRGLLTSAMSLSLAVSLAPVAVRAQGVDLSKWSPEYIRSIAGTETFDTAGDCSKITPLDYKGKVSVWWTGPNDASPDIDHKVHEDFWAAWKATYPNIETDYQNIDYNQLLDKLRTALARQRRADGGAPADPRGRRVRGQGLLRRAEARGCRLHRRADFWPGAIKSVMYGGKSYGIPTNNETMALIWNADIFQQAGLDPESPPKTWDDVVTYSKTIHDKLGIAGYGLVAKQNAGNTPFRFMPQLWAYGGGALDEAADTPTYEEVWINNEGAKAALQASYDMYVRDKSVPTSALTNTQNENQAPFIAGQLGDDDRAPGRVRQDGRPRLEGDRRRQGGRRQGRRQHALRPDPRGPGAAAPSCSAAPTSTSSRTSTSTAAWTSRRRRRWSASGPARSGRPSSPG